MLTAWRSMASDVSVPPALPDTVPPSAVFSAPGFAPAGKVTEPSGFTVQPAAWASASAASSFRLAAPMSKANPFSAVLTRPHSVCA